VANTDEPGKWDHEAVSLKRACEEVFDDMDVEELVVRAISVGGGCSIAFFFLGVCFFLHTPSFCLLKICEEIVFENETRQRIKMLG